MPAFSDCEDVVRRSELPQFQCVQKGDWRAISFNLYFSCMVHEVLDQEILQNTRSLLETARSLPRSTDIWQGWRETLQLSDLRVTLHVLRQQEFSHSSVQRINVILRRQTEFPVNGNLK